MIMAQIRQEFLRHLNKQISQFSRKQNENVSSLSLTSAVLPVRVRLRAAPPRTLPPGIQPQGGVVAGDAAHKVAGAGPPPGGKGAPPPGGVPAYVNRYSKGKR